MEIKQTQKQRLEQIKNIIEKITDKDIIKIDHIVEDYGTERYGTTIIEIYWGENTENDIHS